MNTTEKAESFYGDLLSLLLEKNIPFLVGGTYAFSSYSQIERPTKDFDILATPDDYPRILKASNDYGYRTEIPEPNWLAKIYKNSYFADVIFAEKNDLYKVEPDWFKRAQQADILGHVVKLVPVEELIRSKAYIQHRERHDGADVVHLILRFGKTIDWKLLLRRMEPHWHILASHLLVFCFVYPSERTIVPRWVFQTLLKKEYEELSSIPTAQRITRGLLISSQYVADVTKWGFRPIQELK